MDRRLFQLLLGKNSINAVIGGVGIHLNPCAPKSQNNIEKILPRMIVATFNGNSCTTVIFYYSPINTNVLHHFLQ